MVRTLVVDSDMLGLLGALGYLVALLGSVHVRWDQSFDGVVHLPSVLFFVLDKK